MSLSEAMDFDYLHIWELPCYFIHDMVRVAFVKEVPFFIPFDSADYRYIIYIIYPNPSRKVLLCYRTFPFFRIRKVPLSIEITPFDLSVFVGLIHREPSDSSTNVLLKQIV